MKNFRKYIAIILLGRPGSGKDTQAELLAKKFGLVHIISSKIIERALNSKSETVKLDSRIYNIEKERRIQKSGYLNTPAFVAALVKNEIKKIARKGLGIIISGSPRTPPELKEELPILENLYGKNYLYTTFKNAPLNRVKLSSGKDLYQTVYRAYRKLLKRGGENI